MKRRWIVAGVAVGASLPAAVVSYIAAQVNSQGEYSNAAGQLSLWLLFSRVYVWYFAPVLLLSLGLCLPALLSTPGVPESSADLTPD
jgi:hypothetical protein